MTPALPSGSAILNRIMARSLQCARTFQFATRQGNLLQRFHSIAAPRIDSQKQSPGFHLRTMANEESAAKDAASSG